MEFLAKGKRGLVYRSELDGKEVVVKEVNPTTTAFGHLKHEFEVLKEINEHSIGPRVFSFEDGKLTMEYIGGEMITHYLERCDKENVVEILKKIFEQLKKLDELLINKDELTNPYKHIIIRKDEPIMIDFERARKSEKPQNVNQFCQFLMSNRIYKLLQEKGLKLDKKEIINKAKSYKESYSDKDYKALMEVLRLW